MNRLTVDRAIMMVLVLSVFAIAAYAEVPQVISYQGRLTDSEGNPVADGDYNVTFQIVEHDPLPLGESPLWSSGAQTVTVTDGMFVYYLGSNVPLPAEIFNDDGLDSYFLRLQVEGSLLFSSGTQLVTVPFSVRSVYSDTAAYALSGAGGGGEGGGWVDDGSVVRLQNSGDKVGIGVSTPSEALVVGRDLGGTIDNEYVVCGTGNPEGYAGYKLGFNSDNFAEMRWYGTGEELRFDTRSLGINYLNTLVMRQGNVGIGQLQPREKLVVGDDLGSYSGNRIVVGDHSPADYTGFMAGEDGDNRAFITWNIDNNFLGIGIEDEGTQWNNMIKLDNGEVSLGVGSGDASVQLPENAVSADEIMNETGFTSSYQTMEYEIQQDWDIVAAVQADFPADGYAIVFATGELSMLKSTAAFYQLEFGITDNSGIAPLTYLKDFGDVQGDATEYFRDIINIHERFSVSQGTENFYLVAKMTSGGGVPHSMHNVRLTIVYFPTYYGIIIPGAQLSTGQSGTPVEAVQTIAGSEITLTDRSGLSGSATTQPASQSDFEELRQQNAELRRRLEALEAQVRE